MAPLIQNISDTAKWVAIFRAEESERPDAVFHDPFARKLAGAKGLEIANAIEFFRTNSWTFVARTFLFDEFITRDIQSGCDMVINLAAGFDARPYRMELPPGLRWIEVDLPGIIEEKEQILNTETPRCELKRIPLDLSDRAATEKLINELGNKANKALAVAEGLMIYLTTEEVGALASTLSKQKKIRHWVFDMVSPAILSLSRQKIGSAFDGSKAEFQFAPQEGEEFFLQFGWKILESRSKLKTAAQLNRLNDEMLKFAAIPEPEGPRGQLPWTGVCLFENMTTAR